MKAVMPTQICRIPCSYNHKSAAGGGDYTNKENWSFVKVVNNSYGNNRFKVLQVTYIQKLCKEFLQNQEVEQSLERVTWHYEAL